MGGLPAAASTPAEGPATGMDGDGGAGTGGEDGSSS